MPSESAAVADKLTVAGAVNVALFVGTIRFTVGGLFEANPPVAVHASTSAKPEKPDGVPVIRTRIAFVLIGLKVKRRQTRSLPVTTALGTSLHALPFQYCT